MLNGASAGLRPAAAGEQPDVIRSPSLEELRALDGGEADWTEAEANLECGDPDCCLDQDCPYE